MEDPALVPASDEDILQNGVCCWLIRFTVRIFYILVMYFLIEYYHGFLSEDFDVKQHACQLLQGAIVSEQLAKLSEGKISGFFVYSTWTYHFDCVTGLSLLDNKIHSQVSEHYEDLLQQASGIDTLESVISMMQTHIQVAFPDLFFVWFLPKSFNHRLIQQGFLLSADALKNRVNEPHSKLKMQTVMLSRLQLSCELLRRIIRILSLSRRLEVQLQAGSKEIVKTAQTLHELGMLFIKLKLKMSLHCHMFFLLDQLSKDVDLTGVEIIEKDQKLIHQARIEVEKQAKSMLRRGLEGLNHSQVRTPLLWKGVEIPKAHFFRLELLCKCFTIWKCCNQLLNLSWKTPERIFTRTWKKHLMLKICHHSYHPVLPTQTENSKALEEFPCLSLAAVQHLELLYGLIWKNLWTKYSVAVHRYETLQNGCTPV